MGQPGGARAGGSGAPRAREDRRLRRVRLVLSAVAAAAAAHVVLAEDPWRNGAAARVDLAGFTDPGDAIPFVWCASVVTALVAALLALTARRWLGPGDVERAPALAAPPRPGRLFALALGGALAVCAALAVPRLELGLWDDEIFSARHAMVGRYRMAGDEARFGRVGWRETLWQYRMPNNHVPYSLAARVTVTAHLAAFRPEERLRVELPLRLPALALGLAALAAPALLLWRLGMPGAGIAAAWILALHPWHVRYTSEARGYAMVLLLIPLLALAMVAVLEKGCWRRWAGWGGLQLLLLWTWPAALPLVALLNLLVLALLLARQRGAALRAQLWRQTVAGVMAATAFLQLMLPNLIQLVGYTESRQKGTMGVGWWQDVGAYLLAGMPWRHRVPHHVTPELGALLDASPAAFALGTGLAVGCVAIGAARLVRRQGGVGLALAMALLLSPPLVVGLAVLRGTFLHPWYLVFALPGLAMLAAVGLEGAGGGLTRALPGAPGRAVLRVAAVALLAGFAWVTAPMHAAMQRYPFSSQRDAVLRTRPSLDPNAPANRRILTAAIHATPKYYDPRCVELEAVEDLQALMARADAEGLPLFVNTGRFDLALQRSPELVDLVRRVDLFEPPEIVPALIPRLTRYVYRYRPQGEPREAAAASCGDGC